MRQTIYIDILVSVNFIVDYFLLYAAGHLSNARISRSRLCFGALTGAAGSCVILLPELPFPCGMLITLAMSAVMTFAAFGYENKRRYVRSLLYLFLVTACYGGVMMAVWLVASPAGLIINNSAVYINLSPALLVFMTVLFYTVVSLFSKRLRRRSLGRSTCRVSVKNEGRQTRFEAIVDTGNLLVEPFSGLPVIVAEYNVVKEVLPREFGGFAQAVDGGLFAKDDDTYIFDKASGGSRAGSALAEKRRVKAHLRVIPFNSVGGDGVMIAFKPDEILTELPGERPKSAQAYIGVLRTGSVGHEHHAIVNPDAVE